jgi:TrmH family RNA methyltransferase
MRKAALALLELERELMAKRGTELEAAAAGGALGIGALFSGQLDLPEAVRKAASDLVQAFELEGRGSRSLRALDALRHALLAATGQAPADWDLVDPATGLPDPGARLVIPGLRVYLEDLRSPFNVGSIFRTADAFGVEEILLSPLCADPLHPRSLRSAMGAVSLLPWRRAGLESLPSGTGVFALELGGEPIESFSFPEKGIVLLGSEELGVSAEALGRCDGGRVSIRMSGAKASLNVAVAFGILMHRWTASLAGYGTYGVKKS